MMFHRSRMLAVLRELALWTVSVERALRPAVVTVLTAG
jgi:hypothetical protein